MVRFAGQGFDAVAARKLFCGIYSDGTRYQVTFFIEEVKMWCCNLAFSYIEKIPVLHWSLVGWSFDGFGQFCYLFLFS
jgi:hypothetical protein